MTQLESAAPHHLGNYRASHASPEYGARYQGTYRRGYYFYQWEYIERQLLESILSDLASDGAKNCLDFACGTGRITQIASNAFDDVTGVDVSPSMLEIAKRELANVEFIQQDITQDALPKKYDVATAFRFFTNAEEQLKSDALAAIADALSDDGILVANIHVNRSSVVGWCYRLRNRMAGRLTARVVGHDEFADLLGQHGFEIVRTHWYSYLPRTGWRFPWLARYLMKPVEWICARNPLVPRSVASCFIVVCRKKRTATLAPRAA